MRKVQLFLMKLFFEIPDSSDVFQPGHVILQIEIMFCVHLLVQVFPVPYVFL